MKEHNSCVQKEEPTIYKIGMFAAMNRVTIKTLRHYDEQGLLKPFYVEEDNGYRYYASHQIADLNQILALKNMGFSLEEIKRIQQGESHRELLQHKKADIMKEIANLTTRYAMIENYLVHGLGEQENYVVIKHLPAVHVAFMRVTLKNYDALFDIMPQMGEEMERLGCICAEPDYCFTNYLTSGNQEEQILIETCQAVRTPFSGSDIVSCKAFEEVPEAACILHKGCYDALPKSYARLMEFIEENDYEICGNIRESYIDGVWNKEYEEDWLTEIQVPIRRR